MRNGKLTGTSKVTKTEISIFSPENPNGTTVLILPGGEYGHLAIEKKDLKWLDSSLWGNRDCSKVPSAAMKSWKTKRTGPCRMHKKPCE